MLYVTKMHMKPAPCCLAMAVVMTVTAGWSGRGSVHPLRPKHHDTWIVSLTGSNSRAPLEQETRLYMPLVAQNGEIAASDVTIAVVGEYGCRDEEDPDCRASRAVAEMVHSWKPDFVVSVGGSAGAPDGALLGKLYQEFDQAFFPVPSSADWQPDAAGVATLDAYLDHYTWLGDPRNGYTASLARPPQTDSHSAGRYYHLQRGAWRSSTGQLRPLVHFFAIDSDTREPHGREAGSRQHQWFVTEMAASEACFQVAIMHQPTLSTGAMSGDAADRTAMQSWSWPSGGLDLVLAGRSRNYELSLQDRVLYGVMGLSGASQHGWIGPPAEHTRQRYPPAPDNVEFGALKVAFKVGSQRGGRLTSSLYVVDVQKTDPEPRFVHGVGTYRLCAE